MILGIQNIIIKKPQTIAGSGFCCKFEVTTNQTYMPKLRINPLNEIWKDIMGYEGLYQVSNFARIRSLRRTNKLRVTSERPTPLIRKTHLNHDGYEELCLTKQTKDKSVSVHRLVAIAFVPNPDNLQEVNHEDGDKANNLPYNLKWTTRSGNVQHAFDNNLKKASCGEDNGHSVVSNIIAYNIAHSNLSVKELSKKYNISPFVIYQIRSGDTYSKATGKVKENKKTRLTKDEVLEAYAFDGIYSVICEKLNISKGMYWSIKSGRAYSKITGKQYNPSERKKRVEGIRKKRVSKNDI